jgi:hypothetical protein
LEILEFERRWLGGGGGDELCEKTNCTKDQPKQFHRFSRRYNKYKKQQSEFLIIEPFVSGQHHWFFHFYFEGLNSGLL